MAYFIAGPCAIESVDQFVGFADDLVRLFELFPQFQLVYKGSFDKANRTLSGSPRGVGLVDAEVAWIKLREHHPELMLTTDVHETWQCRPVAAHVDVLQIPAMLGRQTDLIQAAASTGEIVNLKKPIWESVDYFSEAKTKTKGAGDVWATYRGTGTLSGLTVDLHELIELGVQTQGWNTFLDVTHTNRGLPWRSSKLAVAAKALGIRNFFAEVHPDPKSAISDGNNQLSILGLHWLLEKVSE